MQVPKQVNMRAAHLGVVRRPRCGTARGAFRAWDFIGAWATMGRYSLGIAPEGGQNSHMSHGESQGRRTGADRPFVAALGSSAHVLPPGLRKSMCPAESGHALNGQVQQPRRTRRDGLFEASINVRRTVDVMHAWTLESIVDVNANVEHRSKRVLAYNSHVTQGTPKSPAAPRRLCVGIRDQLTLQGQPMVGDEPST